MTEGQIDKLARLGRIKFYGKGKDAAEAGAFVTKIVRKTIKYGAAKMRLTEEQERYLSAIYKKYSNEVES